MNELEVIENVKIEDLIYEIRGKKVMLDSDLAKIYRCKNGTKEINQAVKNNIAKFPERFSWILTDDEWKLLRSKILTLDDIASGKGHYRKYSPRVFTEEGCLMLGTILKSDVAINTTLLIIEAFVSMKKYISSNLLEQQFYKNMILSHDNDIKLLKESFLKFEGKSNEIFYEGQIYDAYSLLLDILNTSKKSIIIIDNFANKKLFNLLFKTDKNVTIYSKNIDNELISKYREQYNNVILIHNDSYHNKFIIIIIDEKILYHCGSSFNDLGTKCFCISKMDNQELVNNLLSSIKYR